MFGLRVLMEMRQLMRRSTMIGGASLRVESICTGACPRYDPQTGATGVPGQSSGGRAGAIGGPDTGNGGYLRKLR